MSAKPSAPRLLPRLVWTTFATAPWSAGFLTVGAVGGGLITAFELMVVQRLVDAADAALRDLAPLAMTASSASDMFWQVIPWIAWLAAARVAALALELAGNLCEVDVQERVGMRFQREVIAKAHSVDLAYFEHPSFYDSLQRANQDMGGRITQLLRSVVNALSSVVGMTAIIAVLWQAHWSLAPITALGVVPGFWALLKMRRRSYWVYRVRTPESRLANYLAGLVTRRDEAKEVRIFTLADHLFERWLSLARRLAVERRQIEVKQSWLSLAADFVATAAHAGCLALLASFVGGARITLGTFAMLMQALQNFAGQIEQVMRHVSALHEQSLYLGDLFEFLEVDVPDDFAEKREEKPRASNGALSPATLGDDEVPQAVEIELKDVSFAYPGSDHLVLKGINLKIRQGDRIALIGENGAGKSTLIRVIMGLYRPTQGQVLINGADVRDIPESTLRMCFAAVFQEFVKYQFPVSENIRFGRLRDATDDDVSYAAELAGAASFIHELPDGYDTLLGRPLGGVDLSGGQWQKLSIARALVRQAPVVVLDEPTAALDPQAEAEVYRQFSEMTRGRTAIFISHRLGSARLANRIVVLKDGRIIEEGGHDELVAADGEYARLFLLQAQWYQ